MQFSQLSYLKVFQDTEPQVPEAVLPIALEISSNTKNFYPLSIPNVTKECGLNWDLIPPSEKGKCANIM